MESSRSKNLAARHETVCIDNNRLSDIKATPVTSLQMIPTNLFF
jgi:hypothetical protein